MPIRCFHEIFAKLAIKSSNKIRTCPKLIMTFLAMTKFVNFSPIQLLKYVQYDDTERIKKIESKSVW